MLFDLPPFACYHCLCCYQLLMIPLIMSVLYVWAQLNKDTIVTFWFGTQFKVPVDACYGLVITQHWDNILHVFSVVGTLSTLGHPGVQLCHWRLVSN